MYTDKAALERIEEIINTSEYNETIKVIRIAEVCKIVNDRKDNEARLAQYNNK